MFSGATFLFYSFLEYSPENSENDTYLRAQTDNNKPKNKIGISVLRVSAGDAHINSGFISTSSIDTAEDYAKKRIRLGNDNYVISIQPFKDNNKKSIIDLNESETDPPSENAVNILPGYTKENRTIIKNAIKTSNYCSLCKCFFSFCSLILQCLQCIGSCFCTPCCFATALFGGIAAAFGVVALGFFGIIPIPVSWTNGICNASDFQRNIYVTYENVTVIDRPFTIASTTHVTSIVNFYFQKL